MTSGRDRYAAKRAAGISPIRKDGSLTSPDTDEQAAAAERFAAESLGCKFNDNIYLTGDGGNDFLYQLEVEVVWLGVNKETGEPRSGGHLIVNPDEPHRWADIYVVVMGSIETGFSIAGWTTHHALTEEPMRDFGYGKKLAMSVSKLWRPSHLIKLKRNTPLTG